jgi:DNA replication protein DnaC
VPPGRYFCAEHEAEEQTRARRDREAEAQENHREWLDEIGVPRAQQGFTFDALAASRCVELVQTYRPLVFHGRALVLLGPTGVGKTAAAIALLASLLPDFQTRMRYELGLSLVRELDDFRIGAAAVERCTRARFLAVDDLPWQRAESRAAGMLEEIFIRRESERRAMLVTSNSPPAGLTTLFSDRVLDRFRVWGQVEAVAGASLRRAPEVTA